VAFGGRIDRCFMALGDVGFLPVAEFPSNEAAMSCAAVVVASGTVPDFQTTPLVPMAEMPQVFRGAREAMDRYKAAGR
jgi:uncharacterized protein with GYD domain